MKKKFIIFVIGSALLISFAGLKGSVSNVNAQTNIENKASNVTEQSENTTNGKINLLELSDKERIQYKMLNSIDFFDSAEGSFEYYKKSTNMKDLIEYSVDVKKNRSYSRIVDLQNNSRDIEDINQDKKGYTYDNKNKTYTVSSVATGEEDLDNRKDLKPKDRYFSDDKGQKGVMLRVDPTQMGAASNVLFNQNIALSFLEDYNSWNIQGEESFLGRDCIKVNGTIGDYYNNKLGGKNFTMLVDKSTGILLKFEVFNSAEDISFSIVSKEILVNKVIDDKKFTKDNSQYNLKAATK